MKRFIVLSLMVCISFLSVFSQRSERILEEGWKFARGRYASAENNHGKTKSVRNQKRNAIFRRKNEMCNKKASKQ